MFDLLFALHGFKSLHFFSMVILNQPADCGVFVLNQSLHFLKRHLHQDKNVSILVLIIKIDWLHSTVTHWFRISKQASIAYQLEGTPYTCSQFTCPCRDKTYHNCNFLADLTGPVQQLVRTCMVLLQLINHLISRHILSNWLSAKHKFASTEKFFQVSPLLEPEAQTGSKIFSEDYITGGTFLRHW